MAGESRRTQSASGLLITGLQQRLFSSTEAFAKTLAVHRKTVRRQWEQAVTPVATTGNLDLLTDPVGADDERATLSEEALAAESDAQVEAASAATIGPTKDQSSKELFDREQRLLDEMAELADKARFQPDGRVRKLTEWIRANQLNDGKLWSDLRVIIFTEYDDTKRYLLNQLNAVVAGSDRAEDRIATRRPPRPVGWTRRRGFPGWALNRRDNARCSQAAMSGGEVSEESCHHTVPGTGITVFWHNGGVLEAAQDIANHSDPRTTKLYDRRKDLATLSEIERRIAFE